MNPEDDEETPAKTYEVGYARPPVGSQFPKGVSGNPTGRPRKRALAATALSPQAIILADAYRTLRARENGRPVDLTVFEASVRKISQAALGGNLRAQLEYNKLVIAADAARPAGDRSGYAPILQIFAMPDNGRGRPAEDEKAD